MITKENRDLRDEKRGQNRQIEALDIQNKELRRENGDLKQEMRVLREEIERKDREIQELRTEKEVLKIENKITGLNLQDLSPSQVSSLKQICE